MSKHLIEKDVKDSLLADKSLFEYSLGSLGETTVLFEKVVLYNKLRTDALIFTRNKGIIGVEFKTEHDNLKRLSRQLQYYVQVCSYVYVFIHESHLAEVMLLIQHLGYNQIGVISYEDYHGTVVPGVFKSPTYNSLINPPKMLETLWKKELSRAFLLNASKNPSKDDYIPSRAITPTETLKLRKELFGTPKVPSKRKLTHLWERQFGSKGAISLMSSIFIYQDSEIEKPLSYYDFRS